MKTRILSMLAAIAITSMPALAEAPNSFETETSDGGPETPCIGDLSGDGTVDAHDLALMLGNYGPCRGCEEDLSGDNYVDEADIDLLFTIWGSCAADASKTVKGDRRFRATFNGIGLVDDDGSSDSDPMPVFEVLDERGRRHIAEISDEDGLVDDDGSSDSDPMPVFEVFDGRGRRLIAEISDEVGLIDDDGSEETPEDESTCSGDLNGDGRIDSTDLAFVLGAYGPCKGCEEDLTGDGFVDNADIDALVSNWGSCAVELQVISPRRKSAKSIYLGDGFVTDTDAGSNMNVLSQQDQMDCFGDLNGDNVVGSADLALVLGRYGRCPGCEEDLNGDGFVNSADVRIISEEWGTCAETEPAPSWSG
ncbi:MAG: hypothetical protein V3W34_19410 [Phycisphaerae bacterium]